MWSDMIVLSEPFIYHCLGLPDCGEPFCIEDFCSECAVESFIVAIFPGAAGIDLNWLDTNLLKPCLNCRAINSDPLSERRYSGFPCSRNNW